MFAQRRSPGALNRIRIEETVAIDERRHAMMVILFDRE
jgi:hypothetical protein